jgi:endonuclease G
MKSTFLFLSLTGLLISFTSCKKSEEKITPTNEPQIIDFGGLYAGWPEGFNSGSKTSYTSGNVSFTTGSWNLNNAVIGTSTSDRKNGTQSVRIQNTGTLTMNFNVLNGASMVTILHGKYGTDANSTWGLFFSTNNGSTWTQTGSTITTSSTALAQASFAVNLTGTIRFQVK